MKIKQWLGSCAALTVGAGIAFGQVTQPKPPATLPGEPSIGRSDTPVFTIPSPPKPAPAKTTKSAADAPASPPAARSPAPPSAAILGSSCNSCSPCTTTCGCDPCMPPAGPRAWLNADYLLWFIRPTNVPFAIATTGPAGTAGIIGQNGTVTRLGNQRVTFGTTDGFHVTGGYWLDCEHNWSIRAGGFFTETTTVNLFANDAVLSRPFFDTNTNTENVRIISLPGAFAGQVAAAYSSRLWGADASINYRARQCNGYYADLYCGFRYLNLEENLRISDSSTQLAQGAAAFNGNGIRPPSTSVVRDRFDTRNNFYGTQVGGKIALTSGKWVLDLNGSVAIGPVVESAWASGSSTLIGGGGVVPATVQGGLLALQSNSGIVTRTEFAVVPEATGRLGFRVTDRLLVHGGYSFLYMSSVLRPGEQVDRVLNPTLIPTSPTFGVPFGPGRPTIPLARTDYVAHGVHFGFTLMY